MIQSLSGGMVSPVEVREKLREELAVTPTDPMDQTDDNVFSIFDADG